MNGLDQRLRAWIARRGAELRLAARTTIAGVLAFAIATVLGLPQAYWAVFTAVIVIQASVGGSLKATLDRLIGTLGGAAYGGAVATLMVHRGPIALAVGVALALAPLALLSALRASFRVAPVTAIIVLLGSASQGTEPLVAALDRVMEIALGCVVGLGVSLLVLPARAHGLVTLAARGVLARMATLLPVLLAGCAKPLDADAVAAHLKALRGAIAKLEAASDEARRERASRLTDEPDPEPLVRSLRRLRNDLATIARAAAEPLPQTVTQRLAPAIARLGAALGPLLAAFGAALVARVQPPALAEVEAALDGYAAAIAGLRSDGVMRALPGTSVAQPFALGFALDQLGQDVRDLHGRIGELARDKPAVSSPEDHPAAS
jgi:uncharacterized membrane protein YgaE (UPF0421/DUF939 family)